ncbi:hypothetical protein EQM14_09280 [Caproiciproducens sp. NJN-50]|nr:hypothetical protein EQM14_09280 [Caproiciproducens sp. NJN-50]
MLVLNLGEDTASTEACAIEHSICNVTLGKMASLISRDLQSDRSIPVKGKI